VASHEWSPRFSKDLQALAPIRRGTAKVQEKELIFGGMNERTTERNKPHIFLVRKLADKKAELDVLAVVFEHLE
jgi:hypothetical protein